MSDPGTGPADVSSETCPSCGAVLPGGRAPRSGWVTGLIVALVVGVVAAVTVAVVVAVGVGRASNNITKALTPEAGRPSGYTGPAYPGMLVQDQVASGSGAAITLFGETVTAGALTPVDTLLGPTLCSSVTLIDDGATTVNVGPGEWKLQLPNGVVETFDITGSLQNGQLAPGGRASGMVCFAGSEPSGQSGTFVLLWQPLLRIGRGVWLFQL